MNANLARSVPALCAVTMLLATLVAGSGCGRTVQVASSAGAGNGGGGGGSPEMTCTDPSQVQEGAPCVNGQSCGGTGTCGYSFAQCIDGAWHKDSGPSCNPYTACPASPSDQQVSNMVSAPCVAAGQTCQSNNGCGGCTVTCTNGLWTAPPSGLCTFIQGC